MKAKATVFLALFFTGAALHAGPVGGLVVGAGSAPCGPRPICRPVVWRTFPTWYSCPTTAFYGWGPQVVVASNGSGFSTVSPMMNYTGQTPVYQVPPPVLPAQPLVTYPSTAFRWRH